jgi:hypothetical protein
LGRVVIPIPFQYVVGELFVYDFGTAAGIAVVRWLTPTVKYFFIGFASSISLACYSLFTSKVDPA